MKIKILILLIILISTVVINLSAQIQIPDSAEERATLAIELEQKWQQNQDNQTLVRLAILYSAIAGLDSEEKETVQRAEKYLSKACKIFPKDYELMASHGSVLTMFAKFETKTGKQLKYVKLGTRKMDRAAKKDPHNIGVLIQRANNSLQLPAFLNRAHYAQKDFKTVLEIVGGKNGPGFKAMVLYHLGEAYKITENEEETKKYWQQVVQLNAPRWSAKAKKALEDL